MTISNRQVEAAHGYYLLGMRQEALQELEILPASELCRTEVVGLRLDLLRGLERWEEMRKVAESWVAREPQLPDGWIQWAYATRRAVSIPAAQSILEKAHQLHPQEPMISYNLGCYHCQQGNLEAAREYLKVATLRDRAFEKMAQEDPDYAPLWPVVR